MKNLIVPSLTFLAGAALATSFFLIRGSQTLDEHRVASSERDDRANPAETGDSPYDSDDDPTSTIRAREAMDDREAESTGPSHIVSDSIDSNETSQSAQSAERTSRSAYSDSQESAERQASSEPYREPLPVADELAQFFEDDTDAGDFHDRMEQERREESWAQFIESQIAAYLTSKPALSTFQISLIQCMAKRYGYANDLFEMAEYEPGITAILMQFARQKSDSTVNSIESLVSHK